MYDRLLLEMDTLKNLITEILGEGWTFADKEMTQQSFPKEETELAKQIIAEKNDIYLEAPNADGEYFNTSDIDNGYGYVVEYSGSFTATVEELIPDYCALPGNTIAVVHFFQDMPFLLRFNEDMSDKLIKGETYVFEFQPFEVEIPDEKSIPSISAHMYSIVITGYRVAEDGETGLNEIAPITELKIRQ